MVMIMIMIMTMTSPELCKVSTSRISATERVRLLRQRLFSPRSTGEDAFHLPPCGQAVRPK